MKKYNDKNNTETYNNSSFSYNLREAFGAKPTVEISGNNRLSVDGIRGILEYSKTRIRVSLGRLSLQIKGRELDLKCISPTSVIIYGYISGVEYLV